MENDIRVAVILRDKKARNDSADTLILGETIPEWNAVELKTVTPEHDAISFNDSDAENFEKLRKNMLIPQKEGESFDKKGNKLDIGQDIDLGLMIIKRGTERFTQPDLASYAKVLQNNKELLEPYVMHTNVDGNKWKNIPYLNDEVIYTLDEEDIGIADDLSVPVDNTLVHRLTIEVIVDGKVDFVNHYDIKDGTLIDRNFEGFKHNYPGYKLKHEIDPFTMQYSFTYELEYEPEFKANNVIDRTTTDMFFNLTINWVFEEIPWKKASTWKHRGSYSEPDFNIDGKIPGARGTVTLNTIRYGTIINNPLMYVPNVSIVNVDNIFPLLITKNTVINIVLRYNKNIRLKPNELASYDYSVIKFNKNGGSSADGLIISKDNSYVIPEQTFKNVSYITIRYKWLKHINNLRIQIQLKYEFDDDAPDYYVNIVNAIGYARMYGNNNNWKVFDKAESFRLSVWHNLSGNPTSGSYRLSFDNLNRYSEYAQGKMIVTDSGYDPNIFHVDTADDGKMDYDYVWKYKDDESKRKSLTIDVERMFNMKNFTSNNANSRSFIIYAISPRWKDFYYVPPTPPSPPPVVPDPPKPPVNPPEPPKPKMFTVTVNCRVNPFTFIRTGRTKDTNDRKRKKETVTHNPNNSVSFSFTVTNGSNFNGSFKAHPYVTLVSSSHPLNFTVSGNVTINLVFNYTESKRYDAVGGTIDQVHIVEYKNWIYVYRPGQQVPALTDPFILTRTGRYNV